VLSVWAFLCGGADILLLQKAFAMGFGVCRMCMAALARVKF